MLYYMLAQADEKQYWHSSNAVEWEEEQNEGGKREESDRISNLGLALKHDTSGGETLDKN